MFCHFLKKIFFLGKKNAGKKVLFFFYSFQHVKKKFCEKNSTWKMTHKKNILEVRKIAPELFFPSLVSKKLDV